MLETKGRLGKALRTSLQLVQHLQQCLERIRSVRDKSRAVKTHMAFLCHTQDLSLASTSHFNGSALWPPSPPYSTRQQQELCFTPTKLGCEHNCSKCPNASENGVGFCAGFSFSTQPPTFSCGSQCNFCTRFVPYRPLYKTTEETNTVKKHIKEDSRPRMSNETFPTVLWTVSG